MSAKRVGAYIPSPRGGQCGGQVVVRVVVNAIPPPIGHSIGNDATQLFSGPVMAPPDLTSAVERRVYFYWLLEVVPGTSANVYANQLILQADKRDGVWFAGDAAPLQPGDQAGGLSRKCQT